MVTPRADERPDRLRCEDLPARGGGAQPCRLYGRHPVVVARPRGDIASADADPHLQRNLRTIVAPRDQSLNLRSSPDCVRRARKHRHKPVTGVLNDVALIRGDRPADQRIVLVSHPVKAILPERNEQLCRTDQVGEQQRDRADLWHNNSVGPGAEVLITERGPSPRPPRPGSPPHYRCTDAIALRNEYLGSLPRDTTQQCRSPSKRPSATGSC